MAMDTQELTQIVWNNLAYDILRSLANLDIILMNLELSRCDGCVRYDDVLLERLLERVDDRRWALSLYLPQTQPDSGIETARLYSRWTDAVMREEDRVATAFSALARLYTFTMGDDRFRVDFGRIDGGTKIVRYAVEDVDEAEDRFESVVAITIELFIRQI